MGKKSFAILFVAVVAIFASYNIYQSQKIATLSDLTLANVEAIAWGWGEDIIPAAPCVPCMPKSCSYTKLIGSQLYFVTEQYVEFAY
ncbi:MAG: NVEALA domain-containing protein [Bacteroides sp.]|uniref:NVEALA domain-containing protein n=1 Tax=Bacteroides sp. TaxID=29523 RepID=UPI002FCA3A53